ncbi:MAG: ABC transporter ATP-binding protein/permease [Clostridia bacterium]|nr:ABC transporter ATP-binding protein/permease [Clostridia bacterium]
MLQLKNIQKSYVTSSETVQALKGVDLSFRQREFVSILGPSGCGKTTLLNIIGGLDHYTDGDLAILGRSTKEYGDRDWDVYRNHRIGFIFQSYNLIPHQTILGNVELALTISGVSKEERIERAKRALDRVGLAGQYYKRPNQLSGGQCQRVAIARALVNDPEILLADEPTGALDTVTSKQIMDLIREISGERLVIMVTHNPEIAEEYSSRIIRLLDGRVLEDTDPFSPEDEEAESLAIVKAEEEREAAELAALESTPIPSKKRAPKKKKEKAKMSFITAFKLSARNLLSKKGRTTMVGIAGSIGIIGIALVLAFSAGIKGFVASMQDDMLSGNAIEIAETGFNANAVSELMSSTEKAELINRIEEGKVGIDSTVLGLAKMKDAMEKLFSSNTITPEYIEYIKSMPESYYNAMIFNYGFNLSTNIYTDFTYKTGEESEHISVKRLTDVYSAVLRETEYAQYASYIPMLVPSMSQAPNRADFILNQYDLIGNSKVATEANEIMLVLNGEDMISDLLLAVFGYYTQEEFLSIVDKATASDANGNFNTQAVYREYFDINELLGKELVYYPNDTVFTDITPENKAVFDMMNSMGMTDYNPSYQYNSKFDEKQSEGLTLKVVGILTPKDNVSFGSLKSGIYYTEALSNYILEANKNSAYIDYLESDKAKTEIGSFSFTVGTGENATDYSLNYSTLYSYTYVYDDPTTAEDESIVKPNPMSQPNAQGRYERTTYGYITPSSGGTSSIMSQMLGVEQTLDDKRDLMIRNLGGNSLANNVLIFPTSFDEKDMVTNWLDRWNESDEIIYVNGVGYTLEMRSQVTYTDTLELIIDMIDTMIDVITYALIAFTSVSLVVSTVMIGIITYVSVVERIKEIGVIRSLGGRKRDVSHLFNAETFIIGLLAGLIGIGFTYLASVIINLILAPLIGYSSIAALPWWQAIMLVCLSVGLTCISGLIPAKSAAKKDPVVALRTE